MQRMRRLRRRSEAGYTGFPVNDDMEEREREAAGGVGEEGLAPSNPSLPPSSPSSMPHILVDRSHILVGRQAYLDRRMPLVDRLFT